MPDEPTVSPDQDDPGDAAGERAEIPLPPPPDSAPRCPWCSAVLPEAGVQACPACGAQLVATEPVELPGLTTIDPVIAAIARKPPPQRSRLVEWLAGDLVDDSPPPSPTDLSAIAPPDPAVRREMVNMELAALQLAAAKAAAGEVVPGEVSPVPTAAAVDPMEPQSAVELAADAGPGPSDDVTGAPDDVTGAPGDEPQAPGDAPSG